MITVNVSDLPGFIAGKMPPHGTFTCTKQYYLAVTQPQSKTEKIPDNWRRIRAAIHAGEM